MRPRCDWLNLSSPDALWTAAWGWDQSMPNCVSLGRPLGGRPGGSPRTSMGWDMTHRGRHRSYQGRPRTPRGRPNCPADVHGTVDALWTQHNMDPGRLWDASGRPLDGRSCPGSVRPLAGLDALGPRHVVSVRYQQRRGKPLRRQFWMEQQLN